jgi:acyl phosphate:glycerol-3-phosphate acyltransferase
MLVREISALVIGYLLGSIPTAYIITRIIRGEDIRKLGGGNIGGLNTLREVGRLPAFFVVFIDIGKGVAAVAIAYWLLRVPTLFVMLVGLMSVIGHIWMIFLHFSGGRGMGAAIGSVVTIVSIYEQWLVMGIFFTLLAIPLIVTRNMPLSMAVAFISLPFLSGFIVHTMQGTALATILVLLVGIKFAPTAIVAWKRSKGIKDFIFHDSNPPGERKGRA